MSALTRHVITSDIQRILVVDDASVRSFLKRGLSFEDFYVDTAENGEQGLRAVLDRAPHMMILDPMIPGIDGFELLRRLRAVGTKLPVIMLSLNDAAEAQMEGLNTGADDYVVKWLWQVDCFSLFRFKLEPCVPKITHTINTDSQTSLSTKLYGCTSLSPSAPMKSPYLCFASRFGNYCQVRIRLGLGLLRSIRL